MSLGESFSHIGISLQQGVLFRVALYVSAFGVIRLLWVLIPRNPGWLTCVGKNSLSIYLGHFYILWTLNHFIPPKLWNAYLFLGSVFFTLFCCAFFCWFKLGVLFSSIAEFLSTRVLSLHPNSEPPCGAASQNHLPA